MTFRFVVILTIWGGSNLNPVPSNVCLKLRNCRILQSGTEGLNCAIYALEARCCPFTGNLAIVRDISWWYLNDGAKTVQSRSKLILRMFHTIPAPTAEFIAISFIIKSSSSGGRFAKDHSNILTRHSWVANVASAFINSFLWCADLHAGKSVK